MFWDIFMTFKGIEDRIALVESAVGQMEANQERTRDLVHSLASALVVHRDAKGRYIKAVQPNEQPRDQWA
jgi:hypothetical protein